MLARPSVGPKPLLENHPRWGLWRIVNELPYWTGADFQHRKFELGNERSVFDVFRRISDLKDVDLFRPWDAAPATPCDRYDNTDYTEIQHIFFGSATLKPAAGEIGRIFFDIPFNNGPEQRTVTLTLEDSYQRFSLHGKRFDRMIADVGFNGTAPRKCIVFILGTIREVRNASYMNLRLAKTLEDIVILPVASGAHARRLSQYLDLQRSALDAERKRLQAEERARASEIERMRAEGERKREEAEAAERLRQRLEAEEARRAEQERLQQRIRQMEEQRRLADLERSSPSRAQPAPIQEEGFLRKIWRAISGS
jgi:hypothetical protein